jgi:hypothetical protein
MDVQDGAQITQSRFKPNAAIFKIQSIERLLQGISRTVHEDSQIETIIRDPAR